MTPAGATDRVRQELARVPHGSDDESIAELGAVLRLAGTWRWSGDDPRRHLEVAVETTSGAVARRVYGLVVALGAPRPELAVRAASGVRRHTTYRVHLRAGAARLGQLTGIVADDGRLRAGASVGTLRTAPVRSAFLRGAVLVAGTISRPGHAPHLELAIANPALAEQVAELVRRATGGHAAVAETPRGARVVVKSGETIGALLVTIGATTAFLDWDDQRLRRSLRSDANRLANADAANLRRTVDAAATQVALVEDAVDRVGWGGLTPELRATALARLANPSASLSELGALCDPPVAKSTVHRRLRRLAALADPGAPEPD